MPPDPILAAFDRLLARRGGELLMVSPTQRATIAEIDGLARAVGAVLGPGLEPGMLVTLAAPNGPGFLASWLAARRAGLAPVLADALAPAAETQRAAAGLGAAAVWRCTEPWPRNAGAWRVESVAGETKTRLAEDIGAVKLTSGSTGTPRGIVLNSAALLADDLQLTSSMGLTSEDRFLAAVPFSHSYGWSSLVMPALMRGALLALPDESGPFGPLAAAQACGATFFPTVPAWVDALSRLSHSPEWPRSVRRIISAGAPLRPETAERFRRLFDQRVHVFYGASECGGIAYDREGGAAERGSVGTPIDGVRVELDPVDSTDPLDSLDPNRGRIVVASAAVAQGTIPEPDSRIGNGRFLSGDLGSWVDGEMALWGRADDLIIVRGKNVQPGEVEGVLRALPGVEDVAVLGIPRPGHSGSMVRAVIACRDGVLTYDGVAAWCLRHLAQHKVPRSVVFVPALPRTARGKLDRAALMGLQAAHPE